MTSCLRLCVHAPVKRAAIDFNNINFAHRTLGPIDVRERTNLVPDGHSLCPVHGQEKMYGKRDLDTTVRPDSLAAFSQTGHADM